jgi:hypothetical protein
MLLLCCLIAGGEILCRAQEVADGSSAQASAAAAATMQESKDSDQASNSSANKASGEASDEKEERNIDGSLIRTDQLSPRPCQS